MKFFIKDQYPQEWITENEAVPPFPECNREPWKNEKFGTEGAEWSIEVESLDDLIELGRRKKRNLFINLDESTIILTEYDAPD